MILWIFLLTIPIILTISGTIGLKYGNDDGWYGGLMAWGVVPLIIFGFVFIVGTLVSSYEHIEDLESIEYYENNVEIQKDKLNRLTNLIETFEFPDGNVLMNSDTPIGSTIEQIGETEDMIASHRESVERVKKNIRHRERYLFSYIPKLIK